MEEQYTEGCSEESCAGCSHSGSCESQKQNAGNTAPSKAPANVGSQVKKVIGVISGKGGVGKSLVTASLARMMIEKGYTAGILDADITGPSIPKMYGVHEMAIGNEMGMLPCSAPDGTRIMSVNLLLEEEDTPVIWRGPVIAGAVKQFWTETLWKDVDYMFVDMPPGTGDVPLTVFQSLPVDGIIIVTSPQELVGMIVAKAVNMAKKMNVPILGIVENMSYLECPDCGKHINVFGESHTEQVAEEYGLKLLAQIPIDPKIAQMVDGGQVEYIEMPWFEEAVKAVENL